MWQFFFFFGGEIWRFFFKKGIYNKGITTLHIFIFRICAEFRTAKPPPNMYLSFWVGFKIGENGFIEFWPPKNRGSPPPVPTLVAAPSGASRHAFSGRHTRPTPWPFSRDNKRTHPTRDHRILVCQFRLLSLILGKQKERERERERERKRAWSRKKERESAREWR